jgi:hypothetical protein
VNDPRVAAKFRREGDDIFFDDAKLSISIASISPVSAMIHFAVNVSNQGTPVKTAALDDFSIDARRFAEKAMLKLASEIESIKEATVKVRWLE